MNGAPEFLSCDWGTTAFRLRWVRGPDCSVLREVREPAGAKSLYEQAIKEGAVTAEGRAGVFARFLRAMLEKLATGTPGPTNPLPLVISGMASSSVGWRELPYAQTPFDLDGLGLHFEELKWDSPARVGTTYLISGMATQHDIMRGEEIEVIGLMSEPSLLDARDRCLLILPGTHSKHVWIKDQSVIDFRTSMTGELFDVLGKYSLLRASVDLGEAEATSLTEGHRLAFQEGVRWAKERGLTAGLFRVRTRAVLDHRPVPENTSFFSGLLIGAELRHLADTSDDSPVLLGAAGRLSEAYAAALEVLLGKSRPWLQIPREHVERASLAGHALVLRKRFSYAT